MTAKEILIEFDRMRIYNESYRNDITIRSIIQRLLELEAWLEKLEKNQEYDLEDY